MGQGPLFVLSGPSGSGKSTVIARLLAAGDLPLRLSVSVTTRTPRDRERAGIDYHFWTREQFEAEVLADGFLEWAEVFGNYYGTLLEEVVPYRIQGKGVILDIDVQGACKVRERCPDVVTIFLRPPSLESLEARLRDRRTESEEAVRRRLAGARDELDRAGEYDYQVINDDLDRAVVDLRAIIQRQFERDNHA
jgi:guanylate kinase